jgi:hypothetical protein
LRILLTLIFRILDRKTVLLVLFIGLTAVNLAEKLSDKIELPDDVDTAIIVLSLLFGGLFSLAELAKKFNIWRFFAPEYRGFPAEIVHKPTAVLRAQYSLIYDADSPLRKFVFLRTDGVIVIDAVGLFSTQKDLINRIVFPGTDAALNRIAAQINIRAFAGTLYGTNLTDKLARNSAISAKNPWAFALVRHESDERLYVGLSSVIPMDRAGATAYCAGTLSDNDVTADVVASIDEPLGAILLFMIAHKPTFADETSRRNLNSFSVIEDLIMTTIIQVALFTATTDDKKSLMVAGAYGRKIEALLNTLGLKRSQTLKSADGLTMFANKIMVKDKASLKQWLKREAPHLLRQAQTPGLRPLGASS